MFLYGGLVDSFYFNQESHRWILQVAIDSATPLDDAGSGAGASGSFMMNSAAESFGGYVGPMRTYGRMYGSLDFDDVSASVLLLFCFLFELSLSWLEFRW